MSKIPYYITPWFLMLGASLTMGLLSFSGILAIWPLTVGAFGLTLAYGAFVLTVAYEGQVYLRNIIESFKKLFKSSQLERQLAKSCLREHCFPTESEIDRPQFFKDYEKQLHLLHRFDHKRLDKSSSERKRQVEKTLGDMEKWFSEQLFSEQEGVTTYQKELRAWLAKEREDGKLSLLNEFQAKRKTRSILYQILKAFCLLSGVFMGMGTTYLLVEAFAVIPWLAALPVALVPVLIVPMAAIAGVAYGFLVYNAMTDMIASEMVTTWFKKIGQDLANPKKWWSGVGKISVLSVMFLITLALSICTAGTWWTVVKSTPPLFSWMGKIPAFIMLGLNPLILSVSNWAFNVENISETLEMAEPHIDAWLGDHSESAKPAEEAPAPDEKCEGFWKGGVSLMLLHPGKKYQKRIAGSKEIVFVQSRDHIVMWYCDNNGECKKTSVNDPKIVSLIKGYAQPVNMATILDSDEIEINEKLNFETYLKRSVTFRLSRPNQKEQTKIMASEEIVFFPSDGHIAMLYCDRNGEYKEKIFRDKNTVDLIKHSLKPVNITNTLNLNEIKAHVLSRGIRTETWLQRWNPFRLFIYFVFDPLRKLLFLGHLAGIGATADQVPGIPPLVPAVVGAASEGVEDIHYFQLGKDAPEEHKHDTQSLINERLDIGAGHDHGSDLPTRLLTILFFPFHFLATCWDFLFSQESGKFNSWGGFCAAFMKSWNKETDAPEEETIEFQGGDSSCEDKTCVPGNPHGSPTTSLKPNPWQTEQALFRIEKEKKTGASSTQDIDLLTRLQETLVARQEAASENTESLETVIDNYCESNLKTYHRNGFFKEKLIERTLDTSGLCVPCMPGRGVSAAAG